MSFRLRLLKGATALLYFGPLLAGLGGFGWGVVAVFVAIFLLWLFILRPQQWPRSAADWARPEALVTLLTQAVTQALLVAVSFGIGRGIGGVMGALPAFPLMLPVAISFLSIPLARMIWDPWQPDMLEGMLDAAMEKLDGDTVDEPDTRQARLALASRMVAELSRLPEETPAEVLADHLAAMAAHVGPDMLQVALMDPIYDGTASMAHRRAAVLHATDGRVADALAASSYAMALFRQLSDTDLLALFAERCSAMLVEHPARHADCPDPEAVLAAAARHPKAAAPLRALAEVLVTARRG